ESKRASPRRESCEPRKSARTGWVPTFESRPAHPGLPDAVENQTIDLRVVSVNFETYSSRCHATSASAAPGATQKVWQWLDRARISSGSHISSSRQPVYLARRA